MKTTFPISTSPLRDSLTRGTALFALVALCAAPTAFAQDPTGGGTSTGGTATGGFDTEVVHLSPEAFDALEAWNGQVATLESVALEGHEDAIREYGRALSTGLGMPLGAYLRDALPASHAAFLEETGQDPTEDDGALVGFLMGVRQDDYSRLQQDPQILSLGLTFETWTGRNYPILEAQVIDLRSRTPAAQGVKLNDFLLAAGMSSVFGEMDKIGYAPSTADCSCWLVMENSDFQRTSDLDDQPISGYSQGGFANIVKRWWEHDPVLDGASKIDYNYRQSKYGKNFAKSWEVESNSTIRMRLHCTEGNSFMGSDCPQAKACTGKAAAQARYGSRIWVRARGAGAKVVGNKALVSASDNVSVNLRIDGSLAGTSREKGAGIQMQIENERATVGQILVEVISPIVKFLVDWGLSGGAFEDALVDWVASGDAFGGAKFLVYGEDDEGYQVKEEHEKDLDMRLNGGGTFPLEPGKVYEVNVDTHSLFSGSGWGANSISESSVDSSYYLAVAHGDYSCNATTAPPKEGGAWMWGAMPNGLDSPATLQSGIATFLDSQLPPFNADFSQEQGYLSVN